MNDQQILNSLFEQGFINHDQQLITETETQRTGASVKDVLLNNGFVGQDVITRLYSEDSGVDVVELKELMPDAAALAMIPVAVARRCIALPLSVDTELKEIYICVADIGNVIMLDLLRRELPEDIQLRFKIASAENVLNAIDRFYGFELSIDAILEELEGANFEDVGACEVANHVTHPLVRLVDAFLCDACKRRASDIHFEPESGFLRIRYRVDGVLQTIASVHKRYWPGCSTRLKVLSGLNIAETRDSQDGAFSLRYAMRPVDIRISTFPTICGENIVLRLLDPGTPVGNVQQLGFTAEQQSRLAFALQQPFGVNLVVGPTGSGKTTTLYSLLQSLSSDQVNIMTLEDPVEYPVPLFRQCSVNRQIKIDFAEGIRSILRQDPDIILVGEIRDRETADMAFRAAMTGHQVFATVHASSALGAYHRLFELGLARDLVAQQVRSIVSQRLLRVLCMHCKEPDTRQSEDSAAASFRAAGCHHCAGTGYLGRTVAAEILLYDEELARLIETGADTSAIKKNLRSSGFKSLLASTQHLLSQGLTSREEVTRVCGSLPANANTPAVEGTHRAAS